MSESKITMQKRIDALHAELVDARRWQFITDVGSVVIVAVCGFATGCLTMMFFAGGVVP